MQQLKIEYSYLGTVSN